MLRTSVLERRGAGEVLQQDFSSALVFRADEAQSNQETAECVLLVVHLFLGGGDALLVLAHLAEGGDEVGVCADLVGAGQFLEPGKSHGVLLDSDWKVGDAQGVLDEGALDFQQPREVSDRHLVQRDSHRKPPVRVLCGAAVLGGVALLGGAVGGFALESGVGNRYQHLLDLFGVRHVIEQQGAVLGDGEVALIIDANAII